MDGSEFHGSSCNFLLVKLSFNSVPYPLRPSPLLSHALFYSHRPPLFQIPFSSSLFSPLESPGSESPAGSPHVVVNSNGSVNGQGTGGIGILGPNPSPDGRQLSPLTSPLLTDAGCVRNDDDEEARRKVGTQTGRGWTENIHFVQI